ncbi:MAG: cation transporting ATPase C-terminal domain-containing protein, partial [Proteobacteria bacterium]|nr:cation transporting ATPase C-terminal domain-containing protein [Pseudomonadota bacterium]
SEVGIPFDSVGAGELSRPQRWRMSDIVRFAAVMGPLSSVFDLATFGLLWLLFHESPEVFRTGWFLESIATQTLVIFLIRTSGRPWRDPPHPWLVASTLGALAVALAIPFSPLGPLFAFVPPPAPTLLALAGLVAVYLVAAELLKPLATHRPAGAKPQSRL